MKDKILRDNKNIFELEEENYYKLVRVNNFWSNNYIEFESNSNKNKTLSVKEYPNKFRPYLKDIINNLKKSDTWKVQLILFQIILFLSYIMMKLHMHSKSDNIEIITSDEVMK